MSNRRKTWFYRLIVILIAFGLVGAAVFIPLLSGTDRNDAVVYIALTIYLVALVATIVINEIIIYRQKKNHPDE